MDTKNSFWLKKGIHDGIPIAFGYLSVGFTLGITARHAGLTPFQATITSLFMNASAGEFAGFTMISGKAGYVEAGIMMLIINARYLLMSCALSQKLGSSASVLHRMLMGYDVTDVRRIHPGSGKAGSLLLLWDDAYIHARMGGRHMPWRGCGECPF